MSAFGRAAFTAAAPEVAVPLQAVEALAPHISVILMVPFIGFSVLLILIGIIVFSTDKRKTPGFLILLLGFGLAYGAFSISSGKK
jgi:hypothetical protein